MSRSGPRVTPASGGMTGGPQGSETAEPAGGRVMPAVRWWPRSFRARTQPGPGSGDGRWGVARLVAEREAQRRASDLEAPDDPDADDGAPVDVVEDRDVETPEAEDQVAEATQDAEGQVVEVQDAETAQETEDRVAKDQVAESTQDAPDLDAAGPDPRDPPSPPAPREPERVIPPSPRTPLRPRPLVPRPPLPAPRRPHSAEPRGPVVPNATDSRAARPRVDPDPALFGFARHTRGRLGGRLFTLFFLLVFALIAVQTIASIV